jgi:hypothetical protein
MATNKTKLVFMVGFSKEEAMTSEAVAYMWSNFRDCYNNLHLDPDMVIINKSFVPKAEDHQFHNGILHVLSNYPKQIQVSYK